MSWESTELTQLTLRTGSHTARGYHDMHRAVPVLHPFVSLYFILLFFFMSCSAFQVLELGELSSGSVLGSVEWESWQFCAGLLEHGAVLPPSHPATASAAGGVFPTEISDRGKPVGSRPGSSWDFHGVLFALGGKGALGHDQTSQLLGPWQLV